MSESLAYKKAYFTTHEIHKNVNDEERRVIILGSSQPPHLIGSYRSQGFSLLCLIVCRLHVSLRESSPLYGRSNPQELLTPLSLYSA